MCLKCSQPSTAYEPLKWGGGEVQWDSNQVCCHYKKQHFFLNTTQGYLQAASATGKTACLGSVYQHKRSSFSHFLAGKRKTNGMDTVLLWNKEKNSKIGSGQHPESHISGVFILCIHLCWTFIKNTHSLDLWSTELCKNAATCIWIYPVMPF